MIRRSEPGALARGLLCALMLLQFGPLKAATGLDGLWIMPDGSALLEVRLPRKQDDALDRSYCTVRILSVRDPVWTSADASAAPGTPRRDVRNPDPSLRARSLEGLCIGTGFAARDEALTGGHLYDPGSGNSYRAQLQLTVDGLIEVRGYVGMALFGRTLYWHPARAFRERVDLMYERGGVRSDAGGLASQDRADCASRFGAVLVCRSTGPD